MGAMTDVWAVKTPQSDDDFYVASGTLSSGEQTLANTRPSSNAVGWQVSVTSNADDSGVTFTVTGVVVGDLSGQTTTEAITGPNTTTVFSTNYFSSISSVSLDSGTAGTASVGYGGNLAIGRARIKALYFVAAATAGSIVVTRNSNSKTLLEVDTPADATETAYIGVPSLGINVAGNSRQDYGIVALTNVTAVTFFCA